MLDPYAILGLDRQATKSDVKRAYRQLANEWHPDKNSAVEASEKFVLIKEAYEFITKGKSSTNKFSKTPDQVKPSSPDYRPYNQWRSSLQEINAKIKIENLFGGEILIGDYQEYRIVVPPHARPGSRLKVVINDVRTNKNFIGIVNFSFEHDNLFEFTKDGLTAKLEISVSKLLAKEKST